ncbi:hypothetical protein [Nocardia sp. NPDC047648]|uniref:hypothetical protein n=1 Tax=Nocardia sp. NPDC047648 TaxID=3155625 RepID=UPI0033E3976E
MINADPGWWDRRRPIVREQPDGCFIIGISYARDDFVVAGQPLAPLLGKYFDFGACSVADGHLLLEQPLGQHPQPCFLVAGLAAGAEAFGVRGRGQQRGQSFPEVGFVCRVTAIATHWRDPTAQIRARA